MIMKLIQEKVLPFPKDKIQVQRQEMIFQNIM